MSIGRRAVIQTVLARFDLPFGVSIVATARKEPSPP